MFQSEFTILRAGFASQHAGSVALFVALVVAIFCGFFYHIAHLVFGPSNGIQRVKFSAWKTAPVIGLALIVVILGFWLPAPIFALIDGASRILAVHP